MQVDPVYPPDAGFSPQVVPRPSSVLRWVALYPAAVHLLWFELPLNAFVLVLQERQLFRLWSVEWPVRVELVCMLLYSIWAYSARMRLFVLCRVWMGVWTGSSWATHLFAPAAVSSAVFFICALAAVPLTPGGRAAVPFAAAGRALATSPAQATSLMLASAARAPPLVACLAPSPVALALHPVSALAAAPILVAAQTTLIGQPMTTSFGCYFCLTSNICVHSDMFIFA